MATSLDAVQAVAAGGVAGIAVAQAIFTRALIGPTAHIKSRRAQQDYPTARLKAEQINSEFFPVPGRAGDYAGPRGIRRSYSQVEDIEIAESTV
jgi:hypothetical protein